MRAPPKGWRMSKKPGSYLLPGLRRARYERELSIRELATKAKLSPDTVWRLETLQRGAEPKTRRRLAAALETTLKELRRADNYEEEVNTAS